MRDCIKARMKGLFLVSLLCSISVGNILYVQKVKNFSEGSIQKEGVSPGYSDTAALLCCSCSPIADCISLRSV